MAENVGRDIKLGGSAIGGTVVFNYPGQEDFFIPFKNRWAGRKFYICSERSVIATLTHDT